MRSMTRRAVMLLSAALTFGGALTAGTCASQGGAMLVVVDKADGQASFINVASLTRTGSVPVGYLPHEIAVSPDAQYAYVTNYGNEFVTSKSPVNKPGNTVSVINLRQRKEVARVDLGRERCEPHGITVSANGERVYITCEAREEIVVIGQQSREILHAIPTHQQYSHTIVVTPDETRAYVANVGSGTITALDLKRREVIKHVAVGAGAEGIALSPDARIVYATAPKENLLARIDAESLTVSARVSTDATPIRVAPTLDGKRLLVTAAGAGTLQVFDAVTLEPLKRIKVGRQPIGLIVATDDRAYVARMNDDRISAIDLRTLEVVGYAQTGHRPDGLAYVSVVK